MGVSPEHDLPSETVAPIEYVNLRAEHLPQVHDLLRRTFWDGIDGLWNDFRTIGSVAYTSS